MRMKLWPLAAALSALLLLAASCGSSSEEAGAAGSENETGSDDPTGDMAHDGHDHGEGIEVPDGMAVPQLSLTAVPDSKSGVNLFIDLTDFTIAPELASTEPVDGMGHLHLYVDGVRRARFYNTALHLGDLSPGEHQVMVEVSANDHSAYTVDGEPIRAMTTIEVTEPGDHGHGDADLFDSAAPPAIDLTITEDPKEGWNLNADVSGFGFAPDAVGSDPVDGEGHLHLYVDGEKIARLYGPWWHVKELTAGSHEIMVEVSANDHSPYGRNGDAVTATVTLEVSEAQGTEPGSDDDMADMAADDHDHGGTGELLAGDASSADVLIEASLQGDDLEIDDRRFSVDEGSTVGILFSSDAEELVHVHGYDLLVPVGPDSPVDVSFLADSPGTFEVELENSGRFLFEIQVR